MSDRNYTITGIVVSTATDTGITGLRVEAWDKDLLFDDLLGTAETDSGGRFRIEFRPEVYREICFDRQPDVYFRIYKGTEFIASTEASVLWNVSYADIDIRILVDLPAGAYAVSVVKGLVRYPEGPAAAGAIVKAFDKKLRSEVLLGEAITDVRGAYDIRYGNGFSEDCVSLIVRAYDSEGTELAASSVVFNPEAEETLDLVVGNSTYRGPSEYERLVKALTPLLEGLTLSELKEDDTHKDITLLSGRSGESATLITLLVTAHRLAERTEIAPEVFYGLLRNDLPSTLSALVVLDSGLIRRSLEMATTDNLIPARFGESIDILLSRFKQLAVSEAVRPAGEGEEKPALVSLVGTVLPDVDRQKAFLEHYVNHSGPIDTFWEAVRNDTRLADQVDSLQFGLQAGALTGNHLPLVQELQRMREQGENIGNSSHQIRSFRDLIYLDESEWKTIIGRDNGDGTVGVPAGTPGSTKEEQVKQYARTLTRIVERSFPTAYVTARLEQQAASENDSLLLNFLQRNADSFEIDGARLETYLVDHPDALSDIPETEHPTLKRRLSAMQRVYRLAPRYEAMTALLEDGIDSAQAIVEMGRELFAFNYGHNPALDNRANAYRVYSRAEQTRAMALAIASDHAMSGLRMPMKALTDERSFGHTGDREISSSARDDVLSASGATADLQTLFGSLELCDCEHCRSVYSPAAYLVDLLHFLNGRQLLDRNSIKRDLYGYIEKDSPFLLSKTTGNRLTAKEVLFERRADLGKIELTCTNTNTPLPYVDLVNEILEDFIAEPPRFSPFDLNAARTADLDRRDMSPALKAAFNDGLSTRDSLSENATIEVVKKGKHWRLHDCAYSYDIRLDNGIPKVKTRGRQTGGSQQELAANPQYLNPKAYEKLRKHVFPLSLPFDLWDAEAKTYLDHLGVQRHRLMEAFLSLVAQSKTKAGLKHNHAIGRARLGLTLAEANLITGTTKEQSGATTPGVWNLWGFAKASGSSIPDPADSTAWIGGGEAWLSVLTGRVDVFLQQSGLVYKELLGLVGTYFVNPLMGDDKRQIKIMAHAGAPEDTCETARLQLSGMDQDAALRALRFIRLWRKLGWSMQDLDRALSALGVNKKSSGAAQAAITLGATGPSPIDDAVLTQLSNIQWLNENSGISVERLLPFWNDIDSARYIDHDTSGQPFFSTLYERLFRNKQVINPPDAAFTEDPSDLDTSDKLSLHRAAIASALGLAVADLDRLLTGTDSDNSFSLKNLSKLYRHALLAKALGLSIRNFLIAVKLAFDPFTNTEATVRFVELVRAISASELTLVELDYLSCHRTLESNPVAPSNAEIAQDLEALRAELQRIAAENRFVDQKSASGTATLDPEGDLTRRKLALLGWTEGLIDEVIATLNDTVVYRVKLATPATTNAKDYAREIAKLNAGSGRYEVPLVSLPSGISIPLDSQNQPLVTHANGKLTASHRLSTSERNLLLTAVAGYSLVESAVKALIDQQDGYLSEIFYDQDRKELCFTGGMRKVWKDLLSNSTVADTAFKEAVEDLYEAPEKFMNSLDTSGASAFLTDEHKQSLLDEAKLPSERFQFLLEKLLPHLVKSLSESATVRFLADALDLETETTADLLSNRLKSPSKPTTSLLTVFLDKTFAESDPKLAITEKGFENQFDAYRLLHKSALVLSRFECTPRQARWLFTYADAAKWPDLNALPLAEPKSSAINLESWLRLIELFEVRDGFSRGEEMLDELLPLAGTGTTASQPKDRDKTAYIDTLRKWTLWSEKDLETLVGDKNSINVPGQLEAVFPKDYAGAALLARLRECFALLERTGLSAADCAALIDDKLLDDKSAKAQAAAKAVKEAARSKYDETQWLKIAPPLRNALRERQRAALVAYLLSNPNPDKGQPWRKVSDVYGYFLIDVEMSSCQLTSRIKQAISSVQMFIQRCLMGLEQQVLASAEIDSRWREWRWMKNYRVWEANRKIFLYPENWIEPELRDDKTPFFKALESELLQTNLTKDTAATAFRNYLDKLAAVARLEVVGMYHERSTDSTGEEVVVDQLHVFGRTTDDPHRYFYRRWVKNRYWTCWENVDLDIGPGTRDASEADGTSLTRLENLFPIPDHLIPIVWSGRLFLFWPIFTEEADQAKQEGEGPKKRWKIQLAWSEYGDGKWLPKRISEVSYRHGFVDSNLKKQRFIFKGFCTAATSKEPSQLNVRCYVRYQPAELLKKEYEDFTPSDYIPVTKRCGRFVMRESNSALVFISEPGYYSMESPSGMFPLAMGLAKLKTDELYLPKTVNDYSSAIALKETPRGNYRLFYAHQYTKVLGLRKDPWFFNDELRTYWVIPQMPWIREARLQNPDPSVNEILGALGSTALFLKDDPFSKVDPSKLPRPMINPGDPLLFGDTIQEMTKFESQDASDVYVPQSYVDEEHSLPTQTEEQLDTLLVDLPVIPFITSRYDYSYRFNLFYHPYVSRFVEALNLNGVDGLLQRPMQLLSENVLYPDEKSLFEKDYDPALGFEALVDVRYPVETVDFERDGAYSQYNWELFFHAPLLIADSLRRNQRFEDAQRWFHFIFDPTDSSGLPVPDRFWRTKPFHLKTKAKYQAEHITLLLRTLASGGDFEKLTGIDEAVKTELKNSYNDLKTTVEDWRDDPFKPHLVARMRTTAYQKTVVMKYLDNLIEWGDQLFRRDTMESINEATQLYVLAADILGKRPDKIPPRIEPELHTYDSIEPLLGEFSNALVRIEEFVPPSALSSGAGRAREPLPSLPSTLYFCVPKNDELLAYWDKVADRLFKIRHCMNIEGVVRQLPLFAPPINPALLVKAAAAGLDIGSVLADVSAPLPHYRFQVLAQKATELCGELKSLGGALLSALEKRDAEKLALLRAEQETAVLKLAETVRTKQVTEAEQQIGVLEASREITLARFRHYYKLLAGKAPTKVPKAPSSSDDKAENIAEPEASYGDANTLENEGVRMISREKSELDNMNAAKWWQLAGSIAQGVANLCFLIPNTHIHPWGTGQQYGGSNIGQAAGAIAAAFNAVANEYSYQANLSSRTASHIMRAHDWFLQETSVAKEIHQIDQQIIAAYIRKDIAEQELSNHKKQIEHAQKVEKTLRDKYTNEELYNWMIGQVSGVYFQTYQLAYDLAKRAERAFRYELGFADSSYIQFGYWDSLKKGLLAGECLTRDLKRMEVAYLDSNRREFEITKHVSLLQLDPLALIELRETGKCYFEVPEILFDLDYPGHYMRRIKTISLTIPCVTGPYTGVNCTLTLVRSSIRHSSLLSGGKYKYLRDPENDDLRFTDSIGMAQSIVTSSGRDDSGLFETNLRDERFLPFEGAGAISTWQLELPGEFRPFDYDTITDVVLHIRYTARAAGGLLKQQAISDLTKEVGNIVKAGNERGLARLFSVRHEFAGEWSRFLRPSGANDWQTLTLPLTSERFPYLFQGKSIKLTKLELYLKVASAYSTTHTEYSFKLSLASGTKPELPEDGENPPTSKMPTLDPWNGLFLHAEKDFETDGGESQQKPGTWTIAAWLNQNKHFEPEALEELLIICHYSIEE